MRRIKKVSELTIEDFDFYKVGMTQSLIQAYMSCPRKLLFKINKWRKKGNNINTLFGNIGHDVLEVVYTKRKYSKTIIDRAIDKSIKNESGPDVEMIAAKAYAVLIEYCDYYCEDDFKRFSNSAMEIEFNVKSGVDRIYTRRRGKIDGCMDIGGKSWLLERKTRGQINLDNEMSYLEQDFQVLFYTLAQEVISNRKVHGVLYDMIRNPQSKPHKGESLEDFVSRLRETIRAKRDHYFIRLEIPINEKMKTDFSDELKRKIKDISLKMKACGETSPHKVFYKNQGSCLGKFACDYIDACVNGNLRGYEQKERLFSELEGYDD